MTTHFVFGYGSLVNRRSHAAALMEPARLKGWRREWCQTTLRPVPFLSVRREPDAVLTGLVAEVPGADWTELDAREYAYDRHDAAEADHGIIPAPAVQIYAVAPRYRASGTRGPILMSYLDVVVQGYLAEFGTAGVAEFFRETDGWDRTVLNDRAAPRYKRALPLTPSETDLVDRHLHALAVTVEELKETDL